MLQLFGFERIGVVLGDLYFVDPDPTPGQEGAERGVRLELRFLDRGALQGSIYSAQPITVGEPIWRADLLESADGPPGTFDRTHHHPRFRGWDPVPRVFDEAMTSDPVGFVGTCLRDGEALCRDARVDLDDIPPEDFDGLRRAVPAIEVALRAMLASVHAGELGRPPAAAGDAARSGWL